MPPIDPEAALHGAQPGKFKPSTADVPPPSSAEPGTLSEGVERYPNQQHVAPTSAPIEHEQTWGDWLGAGWDSSTYQASKTLQEGDNSLGFQQALAKGYQPIINGLGLGVSDNPGNYDDQHGDLSDWLVAHHLSQTTARQQEQKIADLIKAGRAKNPNFMPGVPDDPVQLRAYVLAGDRKERDAARAKLAAAPSGLGTLAAQLGGAAVGSMEDPANIVTLPIGGGGKTVLQVAGREALVNGVLSAMTLPAVADSRDKRGEDPLTFKEAALDVAGGAVAGSVLGSAMHGVGRAAAATGIPQALGDKASSVVGNIDLANTLSYKIYSAMPAPLQRKWGAAIVTKWAKRLADGEKLDDVFANLSNVELATLSKTVVGEDRMTPEERAAAEHLTRTEEVGDSSPFEPTPAGNGAHEDNLENALNAIINDRPVQVGPSLPDPSSDAGASGTAPASPRPPAATSTADRRPLRFAIPSKDFPTEIYEGLKKRGIPDVIAKGSAAGSFAESRGNINARGPITAATHGEQAFGIGQWLGPRKAELFRRYGPSPSLEQQLDFLAWELKGGDAGGKSVLSAKDEVDALHRYVRDFMRPGAGPETDKDLQRGMAALGRAGEQLPGAELAGGMGGSADVPDDPAIARLREEALNLDDQVIGISSRPDGSPVNVYSRRVPVSAMEVDADRFQFKSGGDAMGITDRLRGVEQVDPLQLGRLTLWQDHDGRMFVADGHQRTGLLKREAAATGADRHVDVAILRAADGVTAEDARVMAAIKNLGEDSGTRIDAAKIGRHNADALERAAARLPKNSALIRDGKALAKLSDEAFGAVVNDVIPADYAAVIGHLLPDRPEAHGAMVDLLAKTDPANRGQAESIVRQGIAAGMHTAEQVDLFGEREIMQSLMLERAKVLERGLANLRKSKLLFKTAAKEADTLERVGSTIAKSASEKEAQANAQALELVARLAFTHGPIADALNEAARKLASGAKLADVAAEFAAAVKRSDLGALAGTVADADASRLVVDGAGRGGDAAEAGAPVQEEQPSLIDLERASERFSDPDGPAVKQQAQSAVHDLKAELSVEEALKVERNTASLVALAAILDGGKEGQLGRFRWELKHDPTPPAGDWFSITEDGVPGDMGDDVSHFVATALERVQSGDVHPELAGEIERIVAAAKPVIRRERIKAATHLLEDVKPGEFRAVEPFPEEPGYHRFRYVAKDGKEVGGNYVSVGDTIEAFNIGDVNNPVELGRTELRDLFEQLHAAHPETRYVQAYRKSGARVKSGAGEQEIWIELTDKGVKFRGASDPRPKEPAKPATEEPTLDNGAAVDPAIAERQRQQTELKAAAPMRSTAEQLDTMGLGLFDAHDQPTFRLGEEGAEISPQDLLDELDADDKAIAALKGCL